MADRQVAVIDQAEAKRRALEVIKAHTEAVSFVRQEDLDTQGMFVPVVSVIPCTPEDFHQLGGGQMMPKKHQVDRMGEAAGVNVTSISVEHPSEYVWVGKAHGTKRMPDGSMRDGEADYAFDVEKYAELDFLKDKNGKYTTEVSKRIHLLEYAKFGTQRASTGARLALIRYFCKCPTSFDRSGLPRGMAFARVDLNTDGLLQTPEMRQAAIAHAVGATRDLFGPGYGNTPEAQERNVTPEGQPQGGAAPDPFDDEPAQPITDEPTPEEKELDEARSSLQEWAESDVVKGHAKASAAVATMLANPQATIDEVKELIGKCRKLAERAGGAA